MIGTKHLTRLTPEQVRGVKGVLMLLDDARAAIEESAKGLPDKGFAAEKEKLLRSAEGVKWERSTVDSRLNELLDKGKKLADCCSACGCSLAGEKTCGYCDRTKPGRLPEAAAVAQS